jgi:xanthine dehydrogenase iron-sulfur cluster and FAD-binding subunit A
MQENQRGVFIKLGLRRAQAISLVDVAAVLTFSGDPSQGEEQQVEKAAITLGSVAPTIVHAAQAEAFLEGRVLDEDTILEAAIQAQGAAVPIDDVRSSKDYRREMVRVGTSRALRAIHHGREHDHFPAQAVLLWGHDYSGETHPIQEQVYQGPGTPIITRINGEERTFTTGHHKTLLRLLREEGGLTGTKEGCAEGECGACTVFLDGTAVMSCLVPAPRAHGAEIVTVEGLAKDGDCILYSRLLSMRALCNAAIAHQALSCRVLCCWKNALSPPKMRSSKRLPETYAGVRDIIKSYRQ